MIQDEYIKFETAKLLKEKGFDEKCGYCYAFFGEDDIKALELKHHVSGLSLAEKRYPYVTQSVALKWLREIHDIKVNVWYNNSNYAIEYFESNIQTGAGKFVFIGDGYPTYEQACEAAIKYCLTNLI